MISQVLVPYGLSSILGAVILGWSGIGRDQRSPWSIGNNLTCRPAAASWLHHGLAHSQRVHEASYDLYLNAIIAIGLVLFGLTLVLNVIARYLVWRVARQTPQGVRT